MKAEQRKNRNRMIERFIQGLLMIVLIVLTIFMMIDVNKIQGNARVINYAGIIRGATQREIKLENSELLVIDEFYINSGLLLKKAVCYDS